MLLTVNQLKKSYVKRTGTVTAVDGVSFQLEGGQILGFLGPNGAGKTTTIKMIAGLIQPDDGDVEISNFSVRQERGRALRRVGAVLEGSRNLYWRLSPLENLQYFAGLRGIGRREAVKRGKELLERFELSHRLNHTVQQLSRGMQQKVAICAALIHEPDLLLLDEPTLGLDLESSDKIQSLVLELVRQRNIGVVLTTHQMDVAENLSTRIAIMQSGKIVLAGETEVVLERFAGNTYVVELGADVPQTVADVLQTEGAEFDTKRCFRFRASTPQTLYDMLARVEPLPVVRVQQDTMDLAAVFRRYTQRESMSQDKLQPSGEVEV